MCVLCGRGHHILLAQCSLIVRTSCCRTRALTHQQLSVCFVPSLGTLLHPTSDASLPAARSTHGNTSATSTGASAGGAGAGAGAGGAAGGSAGAGSSGASGSGSGGGGGGGGAGSGGVTGTSGGAGGRISEGATAQHVSHSVGRGPHPGPHQAQTAGGRTVGGGGSAGFEQEKGFTCFSFVRWRRASNRSRA